MPDPESTDLEPTKDKKIAPNPHHALPGKKKNPRRGTVTGKDGEPAKFEVGKTSIPDFDPAEIAEKIDLWWVEGDGDKYLVKNESGGWSKWPKAMINKKMRAIPGKMITLRPRDGEDNSEADKVLLHTMETRIISHALPALAGHEAGIYPQAGGENIMVMKSGTRVIPEEGEWPTVRALIEDRLGSVQSPYFHSWMKKAYESLTVGGPGNFQPGQALIFAGGANSGKSRIQHQLITPMLAGRAADPGPYMFGRSDFNSEMITAEHLLMEDPQSTTLTKDRVFFGESIKAITVNDLHRIHPKGKDAVMAAPLWRLTISINDDPDKMRILPLITPDIEDKLMIFKVDSVALPMPTDTLGERQAFRDTITAELPAYAHWLLNTWEIPEEIHSARFGVKHYHDETLRCDLFEDTPGSEMLSLMDAAEFTEEGVSSGLRLWDLPDDYNAMSDKAGLWHGQVVTLEALLTGEIEGVECTVATKAKQFFRHNNCARLLSRLRQDSPDRIDKGNTQRWKGWIISAPPTPLESL